MRKPGCEIACEEAPGAGEKERDGNEATFDVDAIEGYADRLTDRVGGTSGLAGAASALAGAASGL